VSNALKSMVKKALRVAAPGAGETPAPPAAPPRAEPPVLGHRPGIDRVEYGSAEFEACRDVSNYSVEVGGKTYGLFFFCGHPRSGTHWMDAVLKLHPKAFITGEYRFESLQNALNDLTGKFWHACHQEPQRSAAVAGFRRMIKEILGSSSAMRPGAEWLGDRTPRPLRVLLPGAPHFLIIRDPRDIIVSWAHQEFKNGGFNYTDGGFEAEFGEIREQFLADPDFFKKHPEALLGCERWVKRLAGRWRRHMRVDMECLKKIDAGLVEDLPGVGPWNWQARVHVVRYENIHRDPDGQRAQIYRFLGLDPAEAEPVSDETRTSPRIKEENPHALFRKGEVGDWVRYFTDDVKKWFKEQANDTLVEVGYEKDERW